VIGREFEPTTKKGQREAVTMLISRGEGLKDTGKENEKERGTHEALRRRRLSKSNIDHRGNKVGRHWYEALCGKSRNEGLSPRHEPVTVFAAKTSVPLEESGFKRENEKK